MIIVMESGLGESLQGEHTHSNEPPIGSVYVGSADESRVMQRRAREVGNLWREYLSGVKGVDGDASLTWRPYTARRGLFRRAGRIEYPMFSVETAFGWNLLGLEPFIDARTGARIIVRGRLAERTVLDTMDGVKSALGATGCESPSYKPHENQEVLSRTFCLYTIKID